MISVLPTELRADTTQTTFDKILCAAIFEELQKVNPTPQNEKDRTFMDVESKINAFMEDNYYEWNKKAPEVIASSLRFDTEIQKLFEITVDDALVSIKDHIKGQIDTDRRRRRLSPHLTRNAALMKRLAEAEERYKL